MEANKTILSLVQQYMNAAKLMEKDSSVIVGFSGGADSVALLHILTQLGYTCVAAHCNFHLRGEESVRDENFARDFCLGLNIPFHLIEFQTEEYAKEKNVSIEMAARELRYTWFEELSIQLDIPYVAIAHHKDDSVETVLLNLIRGTGIRGLTGIPNKNRKIIRPLLCISRAQVLSYIEETGLNYVVDSTNNEDEYTRNKIRLNIIPLLETINPSVKESINKTSEHLRQVSSIYMEYMDDAKSKIFIDNKINIEELKKWAEPESILFEILSPYGFNGDTVIQMFNSLDSLSGKTFYSDSYVAVKDREAIILQQRNNIVQCSYRIDSATQQLSEPIQLQIERINPSEDLRIEKDRNISYFDADKVQYPLILRRWESGDWFIPFGMKGRKKISDYFSDNKFSLFDKQNTWILCSGSNVLWIVGHRSDNRFKITSETEEVIRLTLKRNEAIRL